MGTFSNPVTSTTSTTAASYLQPYYSNVLNQAQSASTEAFKPYTGQLTAGLSPLETQAMNTSGIMQLAPQYQSAGNVMNTAATGLVDIAKNQGIFGAPQAQQYMSPYQQGVTDIAKREAETQFQKQQSALRGRLGAAGAFGGSRATLLETEAQRGQNQLLNDLQTRGLQSAFENAQQQFERDRSAQAGALRSAADVGQGLGQLGAQIGADQRAIVNQQAGLGMQQREQQQLTLNNQYEQFLRERGYPLEQAKAMAGILSAVGQGQTTQIQQSTGGPTSLAQGLGLATQLAGVLGQSGQNSALSGILSGIGSGLSQGIGALGGLGSSVLDSITGLFNGIGGSSGSSLVGDFNLDSLFA